MLSLILGAFITIVVYQLPNNYNDLISRTDEAIVPFLENYRALYAAQLVVHLVSMMGLLWVGLDRASEMYALIYGVSKKWDLKPIKIISCTFALILFGFIFYNQIWFDTWRDWQLKQGRGPFHIFHALWFLFVCGADVYLGIYNNQLIAKELFLSSSSKLGRSYLTVLLFDGCSLVVFCVLHILVTVFNMEQLYISPNLRIMVFRWCYLAVSIHFICAFFYLEEMKRILLLAKTVRDNGAPSSNTHDTRNEMSAMIPTPIP